MGVFLGKKCAFVTVGVLMGVFLRKKDGLQLCFGEKTVEKYLLA